MVGAGGQVRPFSPKRRQGAEHPAPTVSEAVLIELGDRLAAHVMGDEGEETTLISSSSADYDPFVAKDTADETLSWVKQIRGVGLDIP